MKILLIAPENHDLRTLPEISSITISHNVRLLIERVTARMLFDLCASERYDVLHFAGHGGPDGILLSDNVLLTADEIATLSRMSGARVIFFNACSTGRLAAYSIRHGAAFVFFAVVDLEDDKAWSKPTAFYRNATDTSDASLLAALAVADAGDSDYGYMVAPSLIIRYIDKIAEMQAQIDQLSSQFEQMKKETLALTIDKNRLMRSIMFYMIVLSIVVVIIFGMSLLGGAR
jgi:hypothetical protein